MSSDARRRHASQRLTHTAFASREFSRHIENADGIEVFRTPALTSARAQRCKSAPAQCIERGAISCVVSVLHGHKKIFHRALVNALRRRGFDQKRANRLQSDSRSDTKSGVRKPSRDGFWRVMTHQSFEFADERGGLLANSARGFRVRASSSAARSQLVDWPCRPRPSSPVRRTSRSPLDWIWHRRPCPGSCRRSRRPPFRSRRGR